jgi:hypothetical protein
MGGFKDTSPVTYIGFPIKVGVGLYGLTVSLPVGLFCSLTGVCNHIWRQILLDHCIKGIHANLILEIAYRRMVQCIYLYNWELLLFVSNTVFRPVLTSENFCAYLKQED